MLGKLSGLVAATAIGIAATGTAAESATLKEVQDRGTVRIAVANEIPYGFIDPMGEAKGPGPEIAKYVTEKLGIKNIEWVTVEFSGLIPGLQADRFDIVAAEAAIKPSRCEQVIYSEPNTSYGEGLLVVAGNPKGIKSFSDFAKHPELTVASMPAVYQLDMLKDLGVSESQIITIQANADAISTVSTGRADAYVQTGVTINGLEKQSNAVEAVKDFVDPVINGAPARSWGGFMFAKGSEDLRDEFNKVLSAYKGTKEWSDILLGYGFSEADVKAATERTTAELCK